MDPSKILEKSTFVDGKYGESGAPEEINTPIKSELIKVFWVTVPSNVAPLKRLTVVGVKG